jgi:hypothetical protein
MFPDNILEIGFREYRTVLMPQYADVQNNTSI